MLEWDDGLFHGEVVDAISDLYKALVSAIYLYDNNQHLPPGTLSSEGCDISATGNESVGDIRIGAAIFD